MRYTSRTGFGKVDWPWWHDLVIVALVFAAIGLFAWAT